MKRNQKRIVAFVLIALIAFVRPATIIYAGQTDPAAKEEKTENTSRTEAVGSLDGEDLGKGSEIADIPDKKNPAEEFGSPEGANPSEEGSPEEKDLPDKKEQSGSEDALAGTDQSKENVSSDESDKTGEEEQKKTEEKETGQKEAEQKETELKENEQKETGQNGETVPAEGDSQKEETRPVVQTSQSGEKKQQKEENLIELSDPEDVEERDGVVRVILPVETSHLFDFIMDPQQLIEKTEAAAYDGSQFEEGATLFFKRSDGKSEEEYSSSSDAVTITNAGDVPVKVIVTASVNPDSIAGITMADDRNFPDDENPSLYLALTDGKTTVPIDLESGASIESWLYGMEKGKYRDYSFRLTGAVNESGNWCEVTDIEPEVTVTWRISMDEDEQELENDLIVEDDKALSEPESGNEEKDKDLQADDKANENGTAPEEPAGENTASPEEGQMPGNAGLLENESGGDSGKLPENNVGEGNAESPENNTGEGNAESPENSAGEGNAESSENNAGEGNAESSENNAGEGNMEAPEGVAGGENEETSENDANEDESLSGDGPGGKGEVTSGDGAAGKDAAALENGPAGKGEMKPDSGSGEEGGQATGTENGEESEQTPENETGEESGKASGNEVRGKSENTLTVGSFF